MQKILAPLIFIITISFINAQEIKRLGIISGMNIAHNIGLDIHDITLNDFGSPNYIIQYTESPGLQGNLFMEIKITDNFSLRPEIIGSYNESVLISLNSSNNPAFAGSGAVMTLSVPILAVYSVFDTKWYGLNIYPGLSLGWDLSQYEAFHFNNSSANPPTKYEPSHKPKYFAVFGIGNTLHTPIGDFIVDFRYQYKLASKNRFVGNSFPALSLGLGYAFNFLK